VDAGVKVGLMKCYMSSSSVATVFTGFFAKEKSVTFPPNSAPQAATIQRSESI